MTIECLSASEDEVLAAPSSLVGDDVDSSVVEISFVEELPALLGLAVVALVPALDEDEVDEAEEVVSLELVGAADVSEFVPTGTTPLLPSTNLNGPLLTKIFWSSGSFWFSSVNSVMAIVMFMPDWNLTVLSGIGMLPSEVGVPAREIMSVGS